MSGVKDFVLFIAKGLDIFHVSNINVGARIMFMARDTKEYVTHATQGKG